MKIYKIGFGNELREIVTGASRKEEDVQQHQQQ